MSTQLEKLSLRVVPLLTVHNYDSWAKRMEMQLVRDKLWAIVSGRKVRLGLAIEVEFFEFLNET
jgi:hypothetical protein